MFEGLETAEAAHGFFHIDFSSWPPGACVLIALLVCFLAREMQTRFVCTPYLVGLRVDVCLVHRWLCR